jgi:hypothetical protein
MNDALDQPQRPLAERKLRATRRAKEIRDEGKIGALDVGKEERRTARRDDAAVNFGGLEKRIDRRGNLDDVVVSPQPV